MDLFPIKKLAPIFRKFAVDDAYVFGSTASGKTHNNSDIDIAVRFKKDLSFADTLKLVNELSSALWQTVDLVDISKAPLPLQFRIFRERKLIYSRNKKAEALARAKALSLYHDYKYYYDRFTKFETERIKKHGLYEPSAG